MATTLRDRTSQVRGVEIRPMPRILVVEDGGGLLAMLQVDVFHGPYRVDAARGAASARMLARHTHHDLIVILLSREESLHLCRALRLDGCTAPLIVLSRYLAQDDVVEALSAGADDCLPATVHHDELRARLRSLYRRYHVGARLGPVARAQLTARYQAGTV
jgi:DNA-binding response OmpR family regulator